MTNGPVLLGDAAKGHLGLGAGGCLADISMHHGGANGDFQGAEPSSSIFLGDSSAITMPCNQICCFFEIWVLLINDVR